MKIVHFSTFLQPAERSEDWLLCERRVTSFFYRVGNLMCSHADVPPLLRGVFWPASMGRNLCCRGPRGRIFFMHSHPLMEGRQPKSRKKLVEFFVVLLVTLTIRLITPVLRVLGVWNLLCWLTPLMPNRLPHFCFKMRRKLFIFSTFQQKKVASRVVTSSPDKLCSS